MARLRPPAPRPTTLLATWVIETSLLPGLRRTNNGGRHAATAAPKHIWLKYRGFFKLPAKLDFLINCKGKTLDYGSFAISLQASGQSAPTTVRTDRTDTDGRVGALYAARSKHVALVAGIRRRSRIRPSSSSASTSRPSSCSGAQADGSS